MSRLPTTGITGRTARIGLHACHAQGKNRVAVCRDLAAIIDGLGHLPGGAPSFVIDCHHYSGLLALAGKTRCASPVPGALL